jgi:hypothetical protein
LRRDYSPDHQYIEDRLGDEEDGNEKGKVGHGAQRIAYVAVRRHQCCHK